MPQQSSTIPADHALPESMRRLIDDAVTPVLKNHLPSTATQPFSQKKQELVAGIVDPLLAELLSDNTEDTLSSDLSQTLNAIQEFGSPRMNNPAPTDPSVASTPNENRAAKNQTAQRTRPEGQPSVTTPASLGFGNEPETAADLPQGSRPMDELSPDTTDKNAAQHASKQNNNVPQTEAPETHLSYESSSGQNQSSRLALEFLRAKKKFLQPGKASQNQGAPKQSTGATSPPKKKLPNFELLFFLSATKDILDFFSLFIDAGTMMALANIFVSGAIAFLLREYGKNNLPGATKNTASPLKRLLYPIIIECIPLLNSLPSYTVSMILLKRKIESGNVQPEPRTKIKSLKKKT